MTRLGMMMLAGLMNNGEGMQVRTCRCDEVARWVRSVSRAMRLVFERVVLSLTQAVRASVRGGCWSLITLPNKIIKMAFNAD